MPTDYAALLGSWRQPANIDLLNRPYDPRGDVRPLLGNNPLETPHHPALIPAGAMASQPMRAGLLGPSVGGEGGFGPGRNVRGGNMPGDFGKWSAGLLRGLGWGFAPMAMAMSRWGPLARRDGGREQRGPGGGYGGSYGGNDPTSKGPGGLLGHI